MTKIVNDTYNIDINGNITKGSTSGGVTSLSSLDDVFKVTYGSTKYSDIIDNIGKLIYMEYRGFIFYLTNIITKTDGSNESTAVFEHTMSTQTYTFVVYFEVDNHNNWSDIEYAEVPHILSVGDGLSLSPEGELSLDLENLDGGSY